MSRRPGTSGLQAGEDVRLAPQTRRAANTRRVQQARDRRRRGARCVTIEIFDREIDALVNAGLLAERDRGNRRALEQALGQALNLLDLRKLLGG